MASRVSTPATPGEAAAAAGGGVLKTSGATLIPRRITLSAVHVLGFVALVFLLNVLVLSLYLSPPHVPGALPQDARAAGGDEANGRGNDEANGDVPAARKTLADLNREFGDKGASPDAPNAFAVFEEVAREQKQKEKQKEKSAEADPSLGPEWSPTWCAHLWKSKEAFFCCHPTRDEGATANTWTERDSENPGKIKFTFAQLYYDARTKEAGLWDEGRGMVVVLMRTNALLSEGAKDLASARVAARETDGVFIQSGAWLEDALVEKIPPRTRTPDPTHTATIIVMISSFRDVLCANTLQELFEHAVNPNRVTVGIVLQTDPRDDDCLEAYCKAVGERSCRRSQVRQLRRYLNYSRGVMPARYLQQTLIGTEEFCFQIDSHMVFPPKWDALAIDDWLSARNEMAVFTTYPNRAADRDNDGFSPARCNTVWGHNVVACGTSASNIRHGPDPMLVAFFGAGIAFNKCHANLAVPYDPYMSFMFKGEEFLRSARLFTHGYDMYAPRHNYAYHFYDDDPKPKGHEHDKPRDRSFLGGNRDASELLLQVRACASTTKGGTDARQSELRWMMIMGMLDAKEALPEIGPPDRLERLKKAHALGKNLRVSAAGQIELFGLGRRRSLRAYQLFSQVNLLKHTNKDICHLLGKMPWIPWDRDPTFEPLGKGCARVRDVPACCRHALAQGAKLVDEHLRLTNEEWGQAVRRSPALEGVVGPILSMAWEQAKAVDDC